MKIHHIIFDWAGTLYDDQHPSYLTSRQVIKELSGRSLSFEQYRKHFTLPVLPFYRRYGVELSLDKINEYFFARYQENCFKGRLFDGVLEALAYFKKQKISMSLFSTMDQKLLKLLCVRLRIHKYFTVIHGSVCDKTIELKKHFSRIKKIPEHVLFLGDTDHDIEAANQDGAWSGCVLNGYQHKARLIKAKPDFVFDDQTQWVPFMRTLTPPVGLGKPGKIK
ncbi:MAG TPA: HAD hydrolase-like protein [bacterium]|nr:HAD hydrolase-like protein [bacterium]